MSNHKEKLYNIVEQLDEKEIAEIVDFAEFLKNKIEKEYWENLPQDDEAVTKEDLTALKEGEEDLKRGKTLTYEEVFGKEE